MQHSGAADGHVSPAVSKDSRASKHKRSSVDVVDQTAGAGATEQSTRRCGDAARGYIQQPRGHAQGRSATGGGRMPAAWAEEVSTLLAAEAVALRMPARQT